MSRLSVVAILLLHGVCFEPEPEADVNEANNRWFPAVARGQRY